MAAPMPLEPPVMRAVFPASVFIVGMFLIFILKNFGREGSFKRKKAKGQSENWRHVPAISL
jgi:hypothetical protein